MDVGGDLIKINGNYEWSMDMFVQRFLLLLVRS